METGNPDDARRRAVIALTELATRTGEDGYIAYDFGETLCDIVTTVAANVGATETLLSGRPGSWEADLINQMVTSTVPDDELLRFRTEPIRLLLDLDEVFESWFELGWLHADEYSAIGLELDDPSLAQDQIDALAEAQVAIDDLYEADRNAYVAAYTAVIREAAVARGVTVPVEVAVVTGGQREPMWDGLAYELHEIARERTPVPGSGRLPGDYQRPEGVNVTDWSVAAGEKAAGRTYRARVAAAGERD